MRTIKVICLSRQDFETEMDRLELKRIGAPKPGMSVISICSENDDLNKDHYFVSPCTNVFNLDVDDCSPSWLGRFEDEIIDGKPHDDRYYNHFQEVGDGYVLLHAMDHYQAYKLALWIDDRLKADDTIYIHCSAGLSRSQAIFRFIQDTYGGEVNIVGNPNNPCTTPNMHIVRMLKRNGPSSW